MSKTWDKVVWPLSSPVPPTLRWNKLHGFIQGHTVELGPTMPPAQFHISSPMGEFICFALELIYKGAIFAYYPITNSTEQIPVQDTVQDLLRAEMSALTLCNQVQHSPDVQSERLNMFREDRDADIVGGEGSGECHGDNDEEEDTTHC